jgi:hypothetical protein
MAYLAHQSGATTINVVYYAPIEDRAEEVREDARHRIPVQGLQSCFPCIRRREEGTEMSQLRKRERGPEESEASAVVVIVQNNGRLRLKVERGMAAPFFNFEF